VSAGGDSGPGEREIAYRLFATEFDDADFSYSESDEERAPNYVVTPTGARLNRLFAVGVLTEVESVSEDVLRGRVVDPTGAFVTYAGQYQPDAMAFLDRADPPAFVAMTGKARTYQPDDSDRVFTSVRPESLNEVDADTRDRWVVTAAEATLERVAYCKAALASAHRGEDLRVALLEAGASDSLAAGLPLAIDRYGTSEAYLAALARVARDALEVVAGERESVRALETAPDERGETAPSFGPLPDVEPLPAADAVAATGSGASGDEDATTAADATAPDEGVASADPPAGPTETETTAADTHADADSGLATTDDTGEATTATSDSGSVSDEVSAAPSTGSTDDIGAGVDAEPDSMPDPGPDRESDPVTGESDLAGTTSTDSSASDRTDATSGDAETTGVEAPVGTDTDTDTDTDAHAGGDPVGDEGGLGDFDDGGLDDLGSGTESGSGSASASASGDEGGLGDFDDGGLGDATTADGSDAGPGPSSGPDGGETGVGEADATAGDAPATDERYELDPDEREELVEEYGAEFETGTEVDDPGEADIDVPDADELAAEAEAQTQGDSSTGGASTGPDAGSGAGGDLGGPDRPDAGEQASSTTGPGDAGTGDGQSGGDAGATTETETETETDAGVDEAAPTDVTDGSDGEGGADVDLSDVDLTEVAVEAMSELDDGDGAAKEAVVASVVDEYGADPDAVEDAIQEALMNGQCYEPTDDRLKAI
jgi:hypothetical protein